MSNTKKILITAAAGKTGTPIVQQLLERGLPVRAMVRRLDERSERLESLGAEVVVGDLHDLQSMRKAMEGVSRVYFCYPPELPQLLLAASNVAVAAKDAGVRGLVNLSQITAREDAPSPLSRSHWLSEQLFDWADVGAVHLRATFFAEMLTLLGAGTIATEGRLYLPYGDEKHAPVTAADIARVASAVLADPAPHAGQRYVLTGPRSLSIAEMAETIGREIGKEVTYVDLPVDAWQSVLTEQVGLPAYLAGHLAHVAQDHQDGVFNAVTDDVARIGGRAPQSVEDFARETRELFVSGDVQAVPLAAPAA